MHLASESAKPFYHLHESGVTFTAVPAAPISDLRNILTGDVVSQGMEFRTNTGKVPQDLVWAGGVLWLLSSRAIEALETGGMTGWTHQPVSLALPRGDVVHDYSLLIVRGRCGALKSEYAQTVNRVSPGGRTYRAGLGLEFEPGSWDGSDMFVADRGVRIFTSDRLRRLAGRMRLRNFGFTALSDIESPNVTFLD